MVPARRMGRARKPRVSVARYDPGVYRTAPAATCADPHMECATLSHMERIGIRELRRDASAILRRVAAGETVEVTDRGRPVAVIVRSMPAGLGRLEREGLLRRGEGDLLDLAVVPLPAASTPPSRIVSEDREA